MVGVATRDVPDLENVIRSGTGSILTARTQRQTEYIAMLKARNECLHTAYMSSHGKLRCDGLLRGSAIPVKFLLVSVNTLPAEHETSNALVGTWSEERGTPSITERDSAQTERVLTRLVVHSPSP